MTRFLSLLIAALLLCACANRGPVKLPEFSEIHFTGEAKSGNLPVPVQGALTRRGDGLKFVVAARQGVVLGYGSINPDTGAIDIKFAQSFTVKRLVNLVGEALIELLPALADHKAATERWTIDSAGGAMLFKDSHLSLRARMEGAP